jgi:hypothetical protein
LERHQAASLVAANIAAEQREEENSQQEGKVNEPQSPQLTGEGYKTPKERKMPMPPADAWNADIEKYVRMPDVKV